MSSKDLKKSDGTKSAEISKKSEEFKGNSASKTLSLKSEDRKSSADTRVSLVSNFPGSPTIATSYTDDDDDDEWNFHRKKSVRESDENDSEDDDYDYYGEEIEEENLEEMGFEEEEEKLPYDSDDFISRPYVSPECTLQEDIVLFEYSFGYDCRKLFNLCVVDYTVLIFSSGNLIHMFDTTNGKKWYRRSYSGGGIGYITKNPNEQHVAVAEKGDDPLIIIFEWPLFTVLKVLKGGTEKAYTFLNYSSDGKFLCSQGDKPDYMLTIWNWEKEKIVLRYRAYGNTVFNTRFSDYIPNHLTSSGIGHIKFWKMEKTFTGLKLLGELGRFGKSETCNIIGFLALADEKVLSGCEWGNILVWDGGLIRVEVCRRGKNFCHEAPITQFIFNNADLTTVAMDGSIKVWYYETIELADPPEEERFIEVDPIYEYGVGDYYHKAKLLTVVKANPKKKEDTVWYGQDGNGGIWKLDLAVSPEATHPVMILQCHSGAVAAIQCSPFSYHFATLGEDGRFFIYDYLSKKMILKKEFLAGGCSLLWLPLAAEESGNLVIGGFTDGVIRVLCISLYEYMKDIPSPYDEYINLIQVSKPHTKPVTVVTINPRNTIIVTGSEDCTIFVYQILDGPQFIELEPVGFVPVPGEVTHCTWKPKHEATILVSCKNGNFVEIELPMDPVINAKISYQLQNASVLLNTFVSIKGEIMQSKRLAEIEEERKNAYLEKLKELEERSKSTGVLINESSIRAVKDEIFNEKIELPEPYVPKEPSPILFAIYIGKTVWLSMGGFDAGYLYEYSFYKKGPGLYKEIPDAPDTEISCYHYYHNHKYLVLGMSDGKIRVVQVNPEDPTDMSKYWTLAMHDNENGTIRGICFDSIYSRMFTCGNDGNIFTYFFSPEHNDYKAVNVDAYSKGFPKELCSDIDDRETLSLEQAKSKSAFEDKMKEANNYKREVLDILKGLEKKFEGLLRQNSKLPKSQQLKPEELILDERVVEDLRKQLEEEMNFVKFKVAWPYEKSKLQYNKVNDYYIKPLTIHSLRVHGINDKDLYVETFRLKELGEFFEQLKTAVKLNLSAQEARGRAEILTRSQEDVTETIARRPNPVEGLLKQIMVLCQDYQKNIKLRRLLRKFKERKDKLEQRRIEWYEMMKMKPNSDTSDPDDVMSLNMAREAIGDYQLKTAADYTVSKSARVNTLNVYSDLLKIREKIYATKMDYNKEVLALRRKKQEMIERHERLREILAEISKEIPKDKIRYPPNLPTYVEAVEFPEKKFEYTEQGVFEELPKRYKALYSPDITKKKEIKLLDRKYEMLIFDKQIQKLPKVNSRLALMKFSGITGSRNIDELQEVAKDDNIITPWEKEFQKFRVLKRLYHQNKIIEEMENDIKEFDEAIAKLSEKKFTVQVNVKFLDLYLLTLHQEVLILKKFEATEQEKESRLFEKLQEKQEVQKKMNEINARVEGRYREIRRCEEKIKNLVTAFHATTAENKFYDFLKRIFKKKYRPPKVKTDDSDSESDTESSSSSEEEDAKSLDSRDMGVLRLDETTCPPGCDTQLYEWTFEQRTARHTLELAVMEEKRHIENHKKEYDFFSKKIKVIDGQYQSLKEDLEEYIREKQRNLNEVTTVAILSMSQIQNFKSESEIEKMSDSVVFSASKLSDLYRRVGELGKETNEEKQKHEKNRKHLTRMNVDINYMKDMIVKLTKEIDEAMIKKFGTKVDLDDLEETLLKRLVAEMHNVVLELEKDLDKKFETSRQKLTEKQNEYRKKIQENTEKHNLLSVMMEEKYKLQSSIKQQEEAFCLQKSKVFDDHEDIENLNKIIKHQESKIQELKKEIAMLKLKSKPKPAPKDQPEVIQRILIRGCDGEVEEIDEFCRDELKDIYEEAQEILQDAQESDLTDDDKARMKKLTSDIIIRLPDRIKEGVLRRMGNITTQEPLTKNHAEKLTLGVVKSLEVHTFIEIMEIVKEIMDSITPQYEFQPESTQ